MSTIFKTLRTAAIILAASVLAASCSKKENVTLVSYNVGVFHKYTENSMDIVASILHSLNADAVAMNELDSMTRRTGGHYQLKEFAEIMDGWSYNYSSAMPYNGGSYGEGLACSPRFKVISQERVPLPQADGDEPRVMAVTELDKFVMASTHLDHVSANARYEQIIAIDKYLTEKYSKAGKPVFLCGDLNSEPDSDVVKALEKNWTLLTPIGNTFSTEDPHECIDYIHLLKNGSKVQVKGAGILGPEREDVREASDHMPVFVELRF